jgi:hypothetical protein
MAHPQTQPPHTNQPDTLATPEGDNESLPNQPLSPAEPTPLRPRGDQPHTVEPLYPAED